MSDVIQITQDSNMYECRIKCSDKVKSFKVEFNGNRVLSLEVSLNQNKELNQNK